VARRRGRRNPSHATGNLLHAELLRQRKDFDGARKAYEAGFAGGANDFASRFHYAELLFASGEPDAAIAQYQAAKACWPQCTDQEQSPLLAIARVLRKQKKLTEPMMETKAFCKRTARAFTPRMQLAEYERGLGNRKAEAEYLEEAIQIDPFMRSLHVQLGDAYVALGNMRLARREYAVGLAVPTAMDRAHLKKKPEEKPAQDSPEEGLARGELCIKLARVCFALGDKAAAGEYLDRAQKEAPDTTVSDEALELRASWKL
jgi:tetratricopeptide (TPR) repeat protein